jgi:hypothetical protein
MKNTKFVIKIENQAEKLAALYWLHNLTGKNICEGVLEDTISDHNIVNYPYIFLDNTTIRASSGENNLFNSNLFNTGEVFAEYRVFRFNQLKEIENFYHNKFEESELYFENVSCILKEQGILIGGDYLISYPEIVILFDRLKQKNLI